MTAPSEVLELECRVRFIKHALQQDPNECALDLWIDGFWEGVKAQHHQRKKERLLELLEKYRAERAIRDSKTVIEGFGR